MKRIPSKHKRTHVKRVTLDLDKALLKQIDRLSEQEDRTFRSVVERTLRIGLRQTA